MPAPAKPAALLIALVWGLGGVLALLGSAVYRLAPYALEALPTLSGAQWVALVIWLVFMGYAEGWRGFHQRFSPRVAARTMYLARNPRALHLLLAPAFCMGLLHATRKRRIVSWSLLLGIAGLVVLVRTLSQPWRGIVDAGVVLGLAIGTASTLWFAWLAVTGAPTADPEVPSAG